MKKTGLCGIAYSFDGVTVKPSLPVSIEALEELLFTVPVPWAIWYDPKQNSFFLKIENEFGSMVWSPKGTKLGKRKIDNAEKYGCIPFGTL